MVEWLKDWLGINRYNVAYEVEYGAPLAMTVRGSSDRSCSKSVAESVARDMMLERHRYPSGRVAAKYWVVPHGTVIEDVAH
ncbi:hypothetical protein FJ959_08750 [Mesorhizobium sp. B2-2-4]|uniref:hypothetical protein n=1 Tax=unclassified Mesorhizobium TaxID=325217 RepID=UPI00112A3021|nr:MULTISPECIES: hypothetical protein [unclassified Mesorhizobium]TPM58953.1 hypothetical protein FJ959_08750 [Mesorhizobium sp. B2-2-4]TPM67438.1 hypothetical protein FJ965_09890 [Mesorhizobium sp. B2-2-1]